jgi:effector-binding domain-containing protein
VDGYTGYRYYTLDQLPRLNRILALKDLGFALDQVARLLDEDVSPAELRGMLRLKQAELRAHMREEEARLARVAARLRQIEQEGMMPDYEIVLKEVEPLTIAAAREVVPTVDQMPARCGALCAQVAGLVGRAGLREAGPWFALYYNPTYTERDIDVEMAVPVEGAAGAGVRLLPGATVASTIHQGSLDTILDAYAAIGRWIETSGHQIAGPCREIYLRDPQHPDPITEIQFPVARA